MGVVSDSVCAVAVDGFVFPIADMVWWMLGGGGCVGVCGDTSLGRISDDRGFVICEMMLIGGKL